jgi:multiple sugar transport system substrate-binding protein
MNKHPFTESLVPLIPIFEQLTGIRVAYEILPEMEYYSKLAVDQSSGGGFIDVFMTGPEMDWQFIPAGWIEPLDDYLNNPKLTDLDWYDLGDFYEPAMKANRWDGKTMGHGGYGQGPVYAIPVTFEIMSLTYRKDLLEQAGIKVDAGWPHTWEDIYTACKATTKPDIGQYGIIGRGAATWASHFGGYSNIFYSYGATDLDENLKPAVASERGVQATELWAKILRDCAPPGVTDLEWFQAKDKFASGEAAMIVDCEWFAAATYEQPDRSQVAGKLGYALTPPGPDGKRVEDLWFWSLGLNPKGYHKDAAWLFLQWATSKPVLLRATTDYQNWNPSRQSVWEDPAVVKMTETWGGGAYRKQVEENRKYAAIAHSVSPYVFTTHETWWRNVQDIILNKVSAQDGLKNAEKQMYDILSEAGVYKGPGTE